jgi:hypothetical protein
MKSMCHDAELAVGRRPQSDVLLHLHDVADRVVLDGAQRLVVDPPRGVVVPGLQQFRRAQEAADVVGAVWG